MHVLPGASATMMSPDSSALYAPAMNASGTVLPTLSIPGANIARGTDTLPTVIPAGAGVSPASGSSDGDLQPIAYAPQTVTPGTVPLSSAVQTTKSGGTVVKHSGAAVTFEGSDVVTLTDGEALISSSHNAVVRAGRHYVVTVASGAMALVNVQNGVLKVRNVYEGLHSPVRVLVDGRSVSLSAGQEVIMGRDEAALKQAMRDDSVGRRRVKSFVVDGDFKVLRADVSLVSLLQKSDLLARLATSQTADDRSVAAKLMKMAAAIMQVTSGRGAYSVADPENVTSEEIKTQRRFNTVADARITAPLHQRQ